MRISGHTVLITGGASGIGYAIAQQLVQMNNKVIVVGRNPDKLAAAGRALPGLITLSYDISKEDDRLALVQQLAEQYGEVSILINNAGIQYQARFDESPPSLADIHQEMETNFVAVVRLSTLLIPAMLRQSEAAIINMSSGLAIAPKAGAAIYYASMAALSTFTRSLRYQQESSSIRVFDVLAPLVDTDMTRGRGRGKISPQTFAIEMISGLERNRYVQHVGKTKLLYMLHRIVPSVAYRITRNGL
jgi:uncharacterized oxidoreductase